MLTGQQWLFVQTQTIEQGVDQVVGQIVDYRKNRANNIGNIRRFKRNLTNRLIAELYPEAKNVNTKAGTLKDYADLTIRYLKATGLFRAKGRGIAIAPVRQRLVEILAGEEWRPLEPNGYFEQLWQGARLPTDNRSAAIEVIQDLTARIQTMGGNVQTAPNNLGEIEIAQRRHELEDQLIKLEELEYARQQANQVPEITTWLEVLTTRARRATTPDGQRLNVPQGEAPAYLEWAVWRSFLAMNSLTNNPWEARRFHIDQDFLPTNTASGGDADMIFEFEDMVIVVEVTLTLSSRQEATEGEPVRRHVAKHAEIHASSGKEVYGLFIAVTIDSNTAHTFKYGDWYFANDSKINLNIVPLAIADFISFLRLGENDLASLPNVLKMFLLRSRAKANLDAPQWKAEISALIAEL